MGGIATFLFLSIVDALGVNDKFKTQFITYKIDNSKCVKIDHTSGSKIFIQDNAFNSTDGKIEILYREFLTPLDMLVNNIPMTTEKNGKIFQLESGGMFEIEGPVFKMKDIKKLDKQKYKVRNGQNDAASLPVWSFLTLGNFKRSIIYKKNDFVVKPARVDKKTLNKRINAEGGNWE